MSAGTFLAVHAPGDEAAGAPWRDALSAEWDGPVVAPDLPGHGMAPAPVGGSYELGDATLALLAALSQAGTDSVDVALGVGAHGWVAHVFALAGRAGALVLVDGLGAPWCTPAEMIDRGRVRLRSIAADPGALAPAPPAGLDPRLRHGLDPHGSRELAVQAAAETTVPTFVIETPASSLDPADLDDLVALFAAPVRVGRAPSAAPTDVLRLLESMTDGIRQVLTPNPAGHQV